MPAEVRQYRFLTILAAVAGDAPTIKEKSLNKPKLFTFVPRD